MGKYEYTIGKDLDLKEEAKKTLATPSLPTNFILKGMFLFFDIFYGTKRTLPKFMVLELLARYPYWVWEKGGYKAITRLYTSAVRPSSERTKDLLALIALGREAQDNEQWHMLLLADIVHQKGIKLGWVQFVLIPQIMAFKYTILTKIIYAINPTWSFAMNAAFESHAEHQYMLMAQENPEWDNEPVESEYFKYYPKQKTLGDLIRRIGLDERDHMYHSLEAVESRTGH